MKIALKRQGLASVLAVLGLIVVIIGVLFATVFRPDTEVTATAQAPDTSFYKTHEGVLNLMSDQVKITAQALDSEEITLVLARGADVRAWLEDLPYTEIVGLQSWDALKIEEHPGNSDAKVPEYIADSDMWQEVKVGSGQVVWEISNPQADQVILAVTDAAGSAPKLTLAWEKQTSMAWIYAIIALGTVLFVLGVTLTFYQKRRGLQETAETKAEQAKRRRLEFERQRRNEGETKQIIETQVAGQKHVLPSRRAIKEARERGESTITVGGKSFETGVIPVVKKVRDVEEN